VSLFWDPGNPSYGPAVDADDGPSSQSNATIDPNVELSGSAWVARDPPPDVRAPDVVLFVDGVLRNDARGWFVDEAGTAHPTLAASYAAGLVRCDQLAGTADVVALQIDRALITPAPGVASVGTPPARYASVQAGGGEQRHLDGRLRSLLSALEARVSMQARQQGAGDDLLVVDGRLRGRRALPRAIGYIKSHSTFYLSADLTRVVTGLRAGQRTPVFGLSNLYSWYLRLPCPNGSPWAGVVRIECSGDLTPQDAIALADRSAVTLPRFASSPYKDPRAPQNLVPIAGLERRLRTLLGDPRLLHRTLVRGR
jgi:hypothetical protein